MESSGDPEGINCPVCPADVRERFAAAGLVITQVKAMFEGDYDTVQITTDMAEPLNFHMAANLLASTLTMLGYGLRAHPLDILHELRVGLDESIAGD